MKKGFSQIALGQTCPDTSPKILFPMFMGIGDALFGTTVAHIVKQRYPRSRMIVATFQMYNEIVACSFAGLDEMWTLPRKMYHVDQGRQAESHLEELISNHRITKIVYSYDDADRFFCRSQRQRRFLDRYAHLKEYYHFPRLQEEKHPMAQRVHIKLPLEARQFAGQYKRDLRLRVDEKIVTVHTRCLPRTSDKNWSISKYTELIQMITQKTGYTVIRLGSKSFDKCPIMEGQHIVDAMYRGELSLLQSAALIDMSDFFIGLDSGLAVIAGAVETPMIVLKRKCRNKVSIPHSPGVATIVQSEHLDDIQASVIFNLFLDKSESSSRARLSASLG
jgi:ADP-heptose:LPS heptosyltransferase